MAAKVGIDCKLYYNTATYGSPTWTELTTVGDVTLNLTKAQARLSSRANTFEAYKGAMKDITLSFDMIWDSANTGQTALQASFFSGTVKDFLVLDGSSATAGSKGVRFDGEVMEFTRGEPLNDGVKLSVTVKPAYSSNAPVDYTAS